MQQDFNNRMAETSGRTRKRGRKPGNKRNPIQTVQYDQTGRIICPACGNGGMRRDGQEYPDGNQPRRCPACGCRAVLLNGKLRVTS